MLGVALRSPMLILPPRYLLPTWGVLSLRLLLPWGVLSPPPLDPGSERSSLPRLDTGAEGDSLSPLGSGAEGRSLPPGRGILPRSVAALLPVLVARDPLLDPRGRPRPPPVPPPSLAALPGSEEVFPAIAGVAPDGVRGTPKRPDGVTSLSLAV